MQGGLTWAFNVDTCTITHTIIFLYIFPLKNKLTEYKQLYTITWGKSNPSAMEIPIELYSFQVLIPNSYSNWDA